MRVLLSAYACRPNTGSEPGIGWNWAIQTSRYFEVWVLTREENRHFIEAELDKGSLPNVHFVYHEVPRGLRWARRSIYLHYYLWQLTGAATVHRIHTAVGFDIAQHVTYATFRFPSLLRNLNVPYIWGPIGGGERPPISFYPSYGAFGVVRQLLRDVHNIVAKYDPLVWKTASHAALVLATTNQSANIIRGRTNGDVRVVPQVAIDYPPETEIKTIPASDTLKLLFIARLTYWKGLHLALPAIRAALDQGIDVKLSIRGEGEDTDRIKSLIKRYHLQGQVEFLDRLPNLADMTLLYKQHDILLFPSLQDSGGMVVLEAMRAGMPVVCLDLGGPGLIVTDDTGIRVPAVDPGQVSRGLADAIVKLAREKDVRTRMSSSAQARIKDEYDWSRKGELIRELYEDVVSNLS